VLTVQSYLFFLFSGLLSLQHPICLRQQDDATTFDVVPNSQFVVSRTAFLDNSSKYHIGSKSVSRGEVVELLKKHGIDMDNNRFLILQGEVEHIATMKPKAANPGDDNGLLEYLEDIIGSNRFVEPIADATKELEVLGVERTRRLNRLRIVEKEKIQLEAAKVQAEEHIAKQKQSYDKKAVLYQQEMWKARKEAEKVESKHHELLMEQAEHNKAMEERNQVLSDLEAKVSAQSKLLSAATKKLDKVKATLKGYENEDVTLQEALKTLNAKHKKAETAIKSEKTKVEDKQQTIEKLTKEKAELERQIAEGEEELVLQEERLQTMREKMSGVLAPLHEQMASKQRELMPFKETLVSCQQKLDLASSKLESIAKRTNESKVRLGQAESRLAESKSRHTSVHELLQQHKQELAERTTLLATTEDEVRSLKAKDAELAQQIITTRGLIDESARSKSSVGLLGNLRKLVPSHTSAGILGKLGELGSIDEKYDVAVTTACGALENIVVTTTEVAQQCVEILKSKRLGRATFIILHEIRDLIAASKAPANVPEGAQRLFDLVTPDSDEARVAFYHALSDTLVCDSLDDASKFAFGARRCRVVTTSGALFDRSGTISGGGQSKASGGMRTTKAGQASSSTASSSSSNKPQLHDLNVLKAQLDTLNAELKSVRTDLQRAETQLSQLKSQVNKLKRQVDTEEADLQSVESAVAELESNKAEAEEEFVTRQKEQRETEKEANKEIKALTAERDDATKKASSGEEAVAKLQKKIDEATGKELRTAEQTHSELQQKVDEWSTTLTKHGVQITSAEKAIVKAQDAAVKAKEDLVTLEAELTKTREAINALTDNALSVTQLQEEANENVIKESKALKELQDECERLKQESMGSRESGFKAEEKLKAVEAQLKDHRELIRVLSMKMDELAKRKAELRIDETDEGLEIEMMTDEALAELDDRELKAIKLELHRLQAELEGGILNIQAILDYREKLKVYMEHKQEVDEINEQFEAKHRELDSLRKQRLDAFMEGHSKINPKLKEMYTMITVSGSADLEISNSTDPFLDGITFSVRPPNKSWRPIQNLSGGEKTLSSLALVFALHYYKPTPLYVMDEIDAALDFKNVSIVANYIKDRTKDAQFLIVSLRNFMFELADRLVGIYKTDNATKSVTINPSSFSLSPAETSR
jgi:structural maintenance of chromosome 4